MANTVRVLGQTFATFAIQHQGQIHVYSGQYASLCACLLGSECTTAVHQNVPQGTIPFYSVIRKYSIIA